MIDTDKYGVMTMKDVTAPIDEETGESPQIPTRWKTKLYWDAYSIVGGGEVICSLSGNKDSPNRKEWAALIADAPKLLAEVKRLREENKKQLNVLTTLDEMIHRHDDHVELMKAFEQGLGVPETWKEMIE